MSEISLYERVLAEVSGADALPKARSPRASAAIVLWRGEAGDDLEVYWVQRAETMPFMGGWHAFPGGGVARDDRNVPVNGVPHGLDGAPEDGGMPSGVTKGVESLEPLLVPGIVAGALRELFEELNLLLTVPASGKSPRAPTEADIGAMRDRLLAKEQPFSSMLTGSDLALDASELAYGGRWLTPPLTSLRFDNRFFLLEWPQEKAMQPVADSSEFVAAEWIRPDDALRRWERGEVITAPPIRHILRVLAEDGPEFGQERLRNPIETLLGSFRCIEFRPGVLLFPLVTPTLPPARFTNSYLLGTGESVLIDPGSPDPGEISRLVEALEDARDRLGRRTVAIWLTHHHPDHMGGMQMLRQALGVPVLAHPVTAERLRARGIPVDSELIDGQVVELAGNPSLRIRVIHTPGHAKGHVCFLDEASGSMIVGDMVAGEGTVVIDPPEGDMDEYLQSLARLQEVQPRTLFPAHGPTIKNAEEKLGGYRQHRLEREAQVLEVWQRGLRELREIALEIYDELPAIAVPLAERQIVAHLDRLRNHGRIGN